VIVVEDFHKCYDRTIAAQGISFRVNPGEVLGLIGPNGAGKTTTLRALTGIIRATLGRLSICGFEIREQPLQAKQNLAYIPDDPQLFLDLSVLEHLAFSASVYGVANARLRIAELLTQFELLGKQDARVGALSRGMRQKVAITCGYIHDPRAILFDEPLTGLDPVGIRTLKDSIRARASAGAAIVISSHLLAMVEDICTHVLILKSGRQMFWGSIAEVRETFQRGDQAATLEDIFFHATGTMPALTENAVPTSECLQPCP
jgi:ABC-2 type transport system ATP-binding protein